MRSFGTEDREAEKFIPPRDEQFEFIVFRGQDIKDLLVCEGPSPHSKPQLPQDPAIVQVYSFTGLVCPSLRYLYKEPVTETVLFKRGKLLV